MQRARPAHPCSPTGDTAQATKGLFHASARAHSGTAGQNSFAELKVGSNLLRIASSSVIEVAVVDEKEADLDLHQGPATASGWGGGEMGEGKVG